MVVEVESSTGNGWHRVDLDSFDVQLPGGELIQNGECDCDHFRFRCRKHAASGVLTRCKHIDAALVSLAEEVVARAKEKRRQRSGKPCHVA